MATRSMPMMCCSPSACISMKKYMHPNAIFCFLMANLFLCAKQIRKPSSFNSPSPMAWRKGCLMDGRSCRSISSKSLTRKGRLPNSGRSRRELGNLPFLVRLFEEMLRQDRPSIKHPFRHAIGLGELKDDGLRICFAQRKRFAIKKQKIALGCMYFFIEIHAEGEQHIIGIERVAIRKL